METKWAGKVDDDTWYVTTGKVPTPPPGAGNSTEDSEKPERTEKPEITEKPECTEAPKNTAAPTATPTVSPTAVPTATPTPMPNPVLDVTSENSEVKITLGGKEVTFPDAKPYIDENDRTQIPVRAAAETIGCKVEYDNTTQTVTIKFETDEITLKIGEDKFMKNGETITMDTKAAIVDDRTYIPLRAIAEALGYEVEWN